MVKYILSLAGGGIRGAITVSLLEELNKYISIYDTFDIYTGSSTGALISCAISHKKMTPKYISDNLYIEQTANKIMNKSWIDYIFGLAQIKPKYSGVGKRQVINNICGDIPISQTEKWAIVPIYDITSEDPLFVRSWKDNYKLSSILDATSAAPCYFPSVEYSPGKWAIDGSIVSHNPTMIAYVEARSLFPEEEIRILSIGTGQGYPKKMSQNSQSWGSFGWATSGDLFDILLNAPMEGNVKTLETLTKQNNDKFVHIDKYIKDTTMDDVSHRNITNLKLLGKDLWLSKKDEILELFS